MGSNEVYIKSGKAAKLLGVSQQTLRNWEYKRIFVPDRITPSGQRQYSMTQVNTMLKNMEVKKFE